MAKKMKAAPRVEGSFADMRYGVGQNADGTFNTFPASELPARVAAREQDDEAYGHAMEQSAEGWPEEDDVSDLDEPDEELFE